MIKDFFGYSRLSRENSINLCSTRKKRLDISEEYGYQYFIDTKKFYYQFTVDTKKVLPEYLEYILGSKYYLGTLYAISALDEYNGFIDNVIDCYPINQPYDYFYLTKHIYENSIIFLPSITEQKNIIKINQLIRDVDDELDTLKLFLLDDIRCASSLKRYQNNLLDLKDRIKTVIEHTPYISKILSTGENMTTEYKSSYHARLLDSDLNLETSNYKGDPRNCIEYSVLKAICAFLAILRTSKYFFFIRLAGIICSVFVGIKEVGDKGQVIGVNNEIEKLHKNIEDEYIRFIETRIKKFFDNKSRAKIKLEMHNSGGKKVLEIKCGYVLECLLGGKDLWTRRPKNLYLIKPSDRYEHLKAREKKLNETTKN